MKSFGLVLWVWSCFLDVSSTGCVYEPQATNLKAKDCAYLYDLLPATLHTGKYGTAIQCAVSPPQRAEGGV